MYIWNQDQYILHRFKILFYKLQSIYAWMSGIQFLFINDVISEISCRETKTKMVRHQNHNRLNKCHFELRRKFHYSLSKSTKSPHLLPPHTPTPASRPSSKNGYRTTCSCSSNVCNLRLDLNYSFSFLTSFFLSFSFFLSQKKKSCTCTFGRKFGILRRRNWLCMASFLQQLCQRHNQEPFLSHHMTKPTKWHVRSAKTQISLGIRPVWLESSLSAWRKLGSLATHWAHSEDSDRAKVIMLGLSWGGSFS